jgi:hypothetical protein
MVLARFVSPGVGGDQRGGVRDLRPGTLDGVTDIADLEHLATRELHDRAVRLAERRFDLRFLWQLVKAIPVAEAAAGRLDKAEADIGVGDLIPLLRDWDHAGEGELGEALRPMYIEYLAEHG